MSVGPSLRMNDGHAVPQLGLGVMYVAVEDVPALIGEAVGIGYRHFDTATHYGNEAGVGEALRRLDIPRDEITVTTKLPNVAHGYDEALRAFDRSEAAIGRIDLYLVHWPQPPKGRYRDCWRALVRLRQEGRVRSIGVANFTAALLDEVADDSGVMPAINQVELHPAWQQQRLRADHAARGVITESWSPLAHGRAIADPAVAAIANRLGCTPAQAVLAWHLASGLAVIPKAADRRHLADNHAALAIALSDSDLAEFAALDRPDGRFGPDPMVHVT